MTADRLDAAPSMLNGMIDHIGSIWMRSTAEVMLRNSRFEASVAPR